MADVTAVSAPAAAAAPAAASAPVSSPAPAAVSAPAAAPVVAAPAVVDPAAAGLGGAADVPAVAAVVDPAAPAVDAAKVAPKFEDFESNEEYLAAKWKHEEEAGTLGKEVEAAAAAVVDPAVPAVEKTAEELAAADEPKLLEDAAPAVTPEVVAKWLDESPELKAALEAKPEVKEAMFTMARENAKLAPLGDIFPNVESAQFANETAGTFVELQSSFQMAAEDPESFPTAFSKFEDLFRLRDDKGEYLKDAAGNIRVGEDFNLLASHLVNGFHASELQTWQQKVNDLQARVDSAVYPNDAAKQADMKALDDAELTVSAYRHIEALKNGDGEAKPDLSKIADPEVRAYYEKKEKELEDQRKALGQDKTDAAKNGRKEARATYETQYRGKFGASVGKRIGELVKEKLDGGTFIPSYVLEDRDPKTNAPMFAVRVLNEFEKKTRSVAKIDAHQRQLQLLAPSEQSMQQRLQYQAELIEQFLPAIIDTEVRKVQTKEKGDRDARRVAAEKRGEVAQAEPRSGATPVPRTMTDEQIAVQARENVMKRGGAEMDPGELNAKVLAEKYRLRGL